MATTWRERIGGDLRPFDCHLATTLTALLALTVVWLAGGTAWNLLTITAKQRQQVLEARWFKQEYGQLQFIEIVLGNLTEDHDLCFGNVKTFSKGNDHTNLALRFFPDHWLLLIDSYNVTDFH